MSEIALRNLQKRNNSLKSRLLHEQLKHGNYHFKNFKKESLQVLSEYKYHKSIFKAASVAGVNHRTAIKWFIQGQLGNPQFRNFYCGISRINANSKVNVSYDNPMLEEITPERDDFHEDYKISQYGDGWSYTTYVDDKKIFVISDELETLKKKVIDQNLPLN